MLAYNVSNPDRPNADRRIAIAALEMAKDTINRFGASQVLRSRIWTVFGKFACDSSDSI